MKTSDYEIARRVLLAYREENTQHWCDGFRVWLDAKLAETCRACKLFGLYWDSDHETKETCDKRVIPDNCSKYLCNDPKGGCPLIKEE